MCSVKTCVCLISYSADDDQTVNHQPKFSGGSRDQGLEEVAHEIRALRMEKYCSVMRF